LEPGEIRHVNPRFLPDGQHFLYGSFAGGESVNLGAVNSKEHKLLLRDAGQALKYAAGRVFFVRAGTLMTQGFDAERLELVGEPSPLAEIQSTGTFDASAGGVLAYQSGVARDRSPQSGYPGLHAAA
jgi:hypothetical protein